MTRIIRNSFFHLIFFLAFSIEAQIKVPAAPQYENQGYVPYYFNSAVQGSQIYSESSNSTGLKEEPILKSQRQAWQAMGYNPPVAPPSDPTERHAFLMNQLRAEMSSLDGNRDKHLLEVMNELHEIDSRNMAPTSNTQVLADYKKAFSTIKDMLEGKTKLSFLNSVYAVETAFGNSYLDYNEYKTIIQQSADFIKQWVKQQNAPLTSDNLHYAIQQFMGSSMTVKILTDDKKTTKMRTHIPFKYDYEDYEGKKDYRNYFATKCLATGTGQCSSMPDVYLLLCEALGIKGYKTFAPMHSFVKYKTAKGVIVNYEPTSHWNLSDKWYQEHMGVTNQAKLNGIYLDTLNKKQCVANALVDLAISYMVNNPNPDTTFIQTCLATSNKYLPKNKNLYGHLAKSSLLQRQLHQALKRHGMKDLSEVTTHSDTNSLYMRLQQNEDYLRSLGYQEMPKEMYEQMLSQQSNKTNGPDAKTKKSLFETN